MFLVYHLYLATLQFVFNIPFKYIFMRKIFLALAAAILFSAAMSTGNHLPQGAYAQENTGAQSVYFTQARSGDPDFPETGFSSSGIVKCPDGRAQEGFIIFGFSALKSPLDDSVKGSWSAQVFTVNRADTGALTELSVDENQFEAKGNLTGGFIAGSKVNSTAIMCDGIPLGENTMVTISGECGQDADVSFAADNGITGTFSGDTTCTAGDTSQQFTLTVESPDFFGSDDPLPLTGMWTTIHTEDGTLVASGFTPLTITGNSSTIYKVRCQTMQAYRLSSGTLASVVGRRSAKQYSHCNPPIRYDGNCILSLCHPFGQRLY